MTPSARERERSLKLTLHQTIEMTRLQVGDKDTSPVNIVVSTVVEAENIVPLLEEYQSKGRKVNVSTCVLTSFLGRSLTPFPP